LTICVARSRGFEISYEDVGNGPAVVLVSGFAWPGSSWAELGYIDRLVDAGHRVLAVDPLGHGLSEKSHDWKSYVAPDVAHDVVAAMDAAGVSEAAVWGYSRGAGLAVMAAVEFPDRVAALVVGGLTWFGSASSADGEIEPWTEALLRGDWDEFWRLLGAPVAEIDKRYMETSSDPRAMGAVDVGRQRSRYSVDPSRVRAPTLVYYGAADAGAVDTATEAFGAAPPICRDGTIIPRGSAMSTPSPRTLSTFSRRVSSAGPRSPGGPARAPVGVAQWRFSLPWLPRTSCALISPPWRSTEWTFT
jgi:pimeloyl-ACP methyl ester carboxylesterase